MNLKKTGILCICMMLMLSGCSRPGSGDTQETNDLQEQATEKTPYLVQVSSLGDLSTQPSLRKTGKLTGKSDVTVSSQSSGRVSTIFYEEGESPTKGSKVISLVDSNNLYNFSASRGRESVEAARINYDSTKVTIDNTLIDLELALKRAQQQYDLAVKDSQQTFKDNEQQMLDIQQQIQDSEQQRILAEYSARTNNPDDPLGSANLSLQKFDSDIEKAEFDYQTKLTADAQTLEGFLNSVEVIQSTIVNIFETTLDGLDKIVGVSPINRTNNDVYEQYLGAQDTQTRLRAEQSLRSMLAYQFQLATFPLTVENLDQIPGYLRQLDGSLDLLDDVLVDVERMLAKTITGNLFPQAQLDALKAQVDGYQSQVVGQEGSIVSQINAIESFLATYQQNQVSLGKQIEILKEQRQVTEQQLRDNAINADINSNRADIGGNRTDIALERTKIGLERANLQAQNSVDQALLSLESARNALAANQRTRDLSLRGLQNSIDQAQVGYSEALANSSKLGVKAPISGSIGEIFIDEGEEVSPGTPLFTMTSTQDQEITILLSSSEKDQVLIGTNVQVTLGEKDLLGQIVSISDIADSQLLYKTTIILEQLSDRIGEIVDVEIPLSSTYTLLPLQAITMQTTKQGSIWVWNGQEPEQVQVDLGDVRGTAIEIRNPIGEGLDLITSPMDNYDRNIHDAVEKEEE